MIPEGGAIGDKRPQVQGREIPANEKKRKNLGTKLSAIK